MFSPIGAFPVGYYYPYAAAASTITPECRTVDIEVEDRTIILDAEDREIKANEC